MAAAMAQARESRDAVVAVFRHPWLRRLNLALAGSVIGDWAFGVAISVYAYERGGPTTVGIVMTTRYLLGALLGPFVAVLADRYDRRRLMLSSDLVRGALTAVAAAVVFADGPALAVYSVYILIMFFGLVFRPAQSSWLPTLVSSPSELTAANATALTLHSVAFFAGPAIAGIILAVGDVGTVFVFDTITFIWSALLISGIHPSAGVVGADPGADGDDASEAAPGGRFAEVAEGFRAMLQNRHLRLVVVLYVAQTVVAGASAVYEVAIALDLLDMGKGGLGVLGAGLGVGGVVGGMLALMLAQRGRMARDFGLGVILWAAPLLLVSAWPSVFTAIVAMACVGLGNSIVDVNAETIIQRLTPNEVLGRVFGALDAFAVGGMALGSTLMPLLIKAVDLRWSLTILGVTVPVVVVVCTAGLRRIDKEALAPDGLEVVRSIPMFAVLPEHTVERLARTSVEFRVPAGATVFHQGDDGDRFYIIESGEVDVAIDGTVVNRMVPGQSFGEIALLRDVPRTATVHAVTDLVLRAIDRRHFLAAVSGHSLASQQADLTIRGFLSPS